MCERNFYALNCLSNRFNRRVHMILKKLCKLLLIYLSRDSMHETVRAYLFQQKHKPQDSNLSENRNKAPQQISQQTYSHQKQSRLSSRAIKKFADNASSVTGQSSFKVNLPTPARTTFLQNCNNIGLQFQDQEAQHES